MEFILIMAMFVSVILLIIAPLFLPPRDGD